MRLLWPSVLVCVIGGCGRKPVVHVAKEDSQSRISPLRLPCVYNARRTGSQLSWQAAADSPYGPVCAYALYRYQRGGFIPTQPFTRTAARHTTYNVKNIVVGEQFAVRPIFINKESEVEGPVTLFL